MEYKVVGIPPPVITWYKIHSNRKEKICVLGVNDDCSGIRDRYLYITRDIFEKYYPSFPNDNATFECVASNSFGDVSKTFSLNVLGRLSVIIMLL